MNFKKLEIGMSVRIDKECKYSRKTYEFYQPKKLRLLGTVQRISDIRSTYSDIEPKEKIVINNWFFDPRDLYPVVTEQSIIDSNALEIIEKNKQQKPKIYFNPEQL